MAASALWRERAAPGATPECMATATKRSGALRPSSAAMPAPADRPATATRARSPPWAMHTRSMADSRVAASASAWPERSSNQFQQPCGLASRSCSG